MNIIDYYNTPVERRPQAEFLGEIVDDVKTTDFKTFEISTTTSSYERDCSTYFQVAAPIVLDDMTEIKNEEFELEVTLAEKVYKAECTLDGHWAPAVVIDTGSSLIYIAQTDDGPISFIKRNLEGSMEFFL